jgi:hypothetical protein
MEPKESLSAKRTRTQWAAQFLTASELVRRGYTVSFTMGNHTPDADLMVGAPSHRQFWVDVKGLSAKAGWLIRNKADRAELYYVLVYLAPLPDGRHSRQPDRFFVLTQAETNDLIDRFQSARPNNKGTMPGFNWRDAHPYEDAWHKLPQ